MPRMGNLNWTAVAGAVLLASALLTALTMGPGADYFVDSGSIDALVRLDFHDFFEEQPLMGPVSLVLRAPFVALDYHGDLTTVYYLGVIPCYAALLVIARLLWVRMEGRPLLERGAVLVGCVASPVAFRALHWGHPEDLLATALCVGAMLAALKDRPVLAGALLGLAFATKQWALVAAAPMLATVPTRHSRFVLTAVLVGAACTLPMLLGDPERFWTVTKAAGSPDPTSTLGQRHGAFPDGRVTPHSLWLPLSTPRTIDDRYYSFAPGPLMGLMHYLIVLVALPLAWAAWRRVRRSLDAIEAFRLLALVLLLRCAMDPNDLDYYHAPLMAALAALAAFGGRAELRVLLLAGAGLGIAFAQPADDMSVFGTHRYWQWTPYMLTVVPLALWLANGLVFSLRGDRLRVPAPAVSG